MQYSHTLGILACISIMGIIIGVGPYSTPDMFLPDQGAHWYYWKLPEPDFWARVTAWTFYSLHQISLWGLIAYAQINREKLLENRKKHPLLLHPVNIIAIGVNVLFVFLHIFQTSVWYDGLAQDVSIWSSLLSVIFLLVFVLMMENRRRGLFFGKKVDAVEKPASVIRRYHGYYFAWAIVYTFWYHPIEDELGHLLGTFYTLLLLLQGSLFFTRFHTNRYWTLLLETFVIIHGAIVAYLTAQNSSWMMFFFGFLGIFVITQMHGIGLSKLSKWIIGLSVVASMIAIYQTDFIGLFRALAIPIAEYGIILIFIGLAAFATWLWNKIADNKLASTNKPEQEISKPIVVPASQAGKVHIK